MPNRFFETFLRFYLLAIAEGPVLAVQDCEELEGKSVEQCVAYLVQPRTVLTDRCVSYAMDQIGVKRYSPAASLLVQFLDYQIRDFSHERNWRRKYGYGPYDPFPGVSALFQLGPPAVEPLLAAISAGELRGAANDNAVRALLLIHRRNVEEAVRVLVNASRQASDSTKAENLIRAARSAADKCPPPSKTKCLNALSQ